MFLSACSFIVCWFPLSFTTCLGLRDNLQCVGFFIYLRILLHCLFLRGHTLRVFHLCYVPVLFSFMLFGVFLLMRLST
jgi:hypothetical protein